jgi:hypothetical protein
MISQQKHFVLAGFVLLAASWSWHQIQVSHDQTTEIARLVKRTTDQRRQIQRLRAERDELPTRRSEPAPTPALGFTTGDTAIDAHVDSTHARVSELRKWLHEHPEERLPEFEFLTDHDWVSAVSGKGNFEVRGSARNLRFEARANLATLLDGALLSYCEANHGLLPADLAQLPPFFVSPIASSILQRYEMRASGLIKALEKDLPIISEKAEAIAASSEPPFVLFPDRSCGFERFVFEDSVLDSRKRSPEMSVAVSKANQAFRLAHSGASPSDADQLLPYFKNPSDAAAFAQAQSTAPARRD